MSNVHWVFRLQGIVLLLQKKWKGRVNCGRNRVSRIRQLIHKHRKTRLTTNARQFGQFDQHFVMKKLISVLFIAFIAPGYIVQRTWLLIIN